MKFNRRGFISLFTIFFANYSFSSGKEKVFYSPSLPTLESFKKIFNLKQQFLPNSFLDIFHDQFASLNRLGYRNLTNECLISTDNNYVIYPLTITGIKNDMVEIFLLFTKDISWNYVGTFNQYESKLFFAITEKLFIQNENFNVSRLLPTKRLIDGIENPFIADDNQYSFRVKLEDDKLLGKVIFKNNYIVDEAVELSFAT
jgi:hypothetical protein